MGIESQKVADITGIDTRIGKYGTVHGKAFISFADKYHMPRLLKAVDDINEEMKSKYVVRE